MTKEVTGKEEKISKDKYTHPNITKQKDENHYHNTYTHCTSFATITEKFCVIGMGPNKAENA